MAEQKYFVDTTFNWADEIDIGGFCIITQEDLDTYRAVANRLDPGETVSYYCGSNEEAEFSKEKILDMLNDARPITDEEARVIREFVPYKCFNNIFDEILDFDEED